MIRSQIIALEEYVSGRTYRRIFRCYPLCCPVFKHRPISQTRSFRCLERKLTSLTSSARAVHAARTSRKHEYAQLLMTGNLCGVLAGVA